MKKMLSALLSTVLLLSLFGCGAAMNSGASADTQTNGFAFSDQNKYESSMGFDSAAPMEPESAAPGYNAVETPSSSLPENRMGWGMGLMQTALSSGTIMGPLMGGYMASWFGMRMSFYVGSLALFAGTIAVMLVVKDLTILQRGSFNASSLWHDLQDTLRNRELRFIMLMFFMVQTCVMTIQPLITMYVGQLMGAMGDDAVKMSGVIFSLAGFAGILAAPFWGKRRQSYG